MSGNEDVMAVALITGTLAFVVIISSTVYSRWLRSRGRRVSGAITADVAMGWVLVAVTTVLLVSNAINSHD